MPRGLDVFDYAIPKEFESVIRPGQLVTIPLRKSIVYGLVFSLPKKTSISSDVSVKSIESILHNEPIISPLQCRQIRAMSAQYGLSFGTIAKMCLLPLQKRKLNHIRLSPLPNNTTSKKNTPGPAYHYYTSKKEHAAVFDAIDGQTLILVPEVHMIDAILAILPKAHRKNAIGWHGSLATKEQFERWLLIRNGEKKIVVATRAGVFLPFCDLKTIIVDAEHDDNHKHWDQAPRFHAKDIVHFLCRESGAALHLASFSPSVESYYHVHKGHYTGKDSLALDALDATVIDMANERRGKNFSLLSETLEAALLAATSDVFLFINRLGYATSARCNDCGYTAHCEACKTPLVYHNNTAMLHCHYCQTHREMPLHCPACGSTMVQLRGIGTQQVEILIRKLFGGNLRHAIQRIDSTGALPVKTGGKPRLIIGTEMAFRHIDWQRTELIAFLDIDKQLALPEYTADEHVWHRIREVDYRKKEASTFIIQTFNVKQLVIKSLTEPHRFYRTDLNHRRAFGYPPYQYLVRYFFGHESESIAKQSIEAVRNVLEHSLTTQKNTAILSHSIEMHPRFYRKKYWYMMLVKLAPDTGWEKLESLNRIIPTQGWKIDPRPISILSP